ncbi:hypothetical protein [Vogesella indigofera]|uniref:hypothetical protein n=1 Tax=Vogesella indigofera TaxID=45465 RepID=UPI003F428C82
MSIEMFQSETGEFSEEEFIAQTRAEWEEQAYYTQLNLGAELHWFFTQAADAHRKGLYISACTSFLIGIEASLRLTLALIDSPNKPILSPEKTLSNRLIKTARTNGLPVELLAFEGEHDFDAKLASSPKQKVNVELVRLRHDLCHGNFLSYHQKIPEIGEIFTPECMRETSEKLYTLSKRWAKALSDFRNHHTMLSKQP